MVSEEINIKPRALTSFNLLNFDVEHDIFDIKRQ